MKFLLIPAFQTCAARCAQRTAKCDAKGHENSVGSCITLVWEFSRLLEHVLLEEKLYAHIYYWCTTVMQQWAGMIFSVHRRQQKFASSKVILWVASWYSIDLSLLWGKTVHCRILFICRPTKHNWLDLGPSKGYISLFFCLAAQFCRP